MPICLIIETGMHLNLVLWQDISSLQLCKWSLFIGISTLLGFPLPLCLLIFWFCVLSCLIILSNNLSCCGVWNILYLCFSHKSSYYCMIGFTYVAHPHIDVARAFLEQCSSGKTDTTSTASADGMVDSTDSTYQHVNVLVTSGSLIPSLVKCLLFRLDNLITHENGKSFFSSFHV